MPKMNSCFGRSTDPIDTDGRVKRPSAFFNTRKTDIILSFDDLPAAGAVAQLARIGSGHRSWHVPVIEGTA